MNTNEMLTTLMLKGIRNVKMGCKDGSGFFFAGDLNDSTLDDAENNIVRTNEAVYNARKKDLTKAHLSMVTAKAHMDAHKPLADREVVEYYKSITEPNCMIVLVEGNDMGLWWTMSEAKNGIKDALKEFEKGESDESIES